MIDSTFQVWKATSLGTHMLCCTLLSYNNLYKSRALQLLLPIVAFLLISPNIASVAEHVFDFNKMGSHCLGFMLRSQINTKRFPCESSLEYLKCKRSFPFSSWLLETTECAAAEKQIAKYCSLFPSTALKPLLQSIMIQR